MTYRIIATEADIRDGIRALRRRCPTMRRVHDAVGNPPVRRVPDGFVGLCRIVVSQQVSTASANAIWQRTAAAIVPFEPAVLLKLNDAALAAAGLSRPKIRTLRAVASAVQDGTLDLDRLTRQPDDAVREALIAVSGIGPWTSDIFLMFALGRADAWAPGDLGLQLAAQSLFELNERPSADELTAIAERWRPWRAVAALLLWSHYAAEKRRPALPVGEGAKQPKQRRKTV